MEFDNGEKTCCELTTNQKVKFERKIKKFFSPWRSSSNKEELFFATTRDFIVKYKKIMKYPLVLRIFCNYLLQCLGECSCSDVVVITKTIRMYIFIEKCYKVMEVCGEISKNEEHFSDEETVVDKRFLPFLDEDLLLKYPDLFFNRSIFLPEMEIYAAMWKSDNSRDHLQEEDMDLNGENESSSGLDSSSDGQSNVVPVVNMSEEQILSPEAASRISPVEERVSAEVDLPPDVERFISEDDLLPDEEHLNSEADRPPDEEHFISDADPPADEEHFIPEEVLPPDEERFIYEDDCLPVEERFNSEDERISGDDRISDERLTEDERLSNEESAAVEVDQPTEEEWHDFILKFWDDEPKFNYTCWPRKIFMKLTETACNDGDFTALRFLVYYGINDFSPDVQGCIEMAEESEHYLKSFYATKGFEFDEPLTVKRRGLIKADAERICDNLHDLRGFALLMMAECSVISFELSQTYALYSECANLIYNTIRNRYFTQEELKDFIEKWHGPLTKPITLKLVLDGLTNLFPKIKQRRSFVPQLTHLCRLKIRDCLTTSRKPLGTQVSQLNIEPEYRNYILCKTGNLNTDVEKNVEKLMEWNTRQERRGQKRPLED